MSQSDPNNPQARESVQSEVSDHDDSSVDPRIASLSTHELILKLYASMSRIEGTQIPKITKSISDLQANQVETAAKLEILEDKERNNEKEIEKNREETEKIKESIKQVNHKQKANMNEIKTMTDEIDNKIEEKSEKMKELETRINKIEKNKIKDNDHNKTVSNNEITKMKEKINEIEEERISRMKKMEENFRKEMDKKIQSLQQEINSIGGMKKPNQKNNENSLREELQLAESNQQESNGLDYRAATTNNVEKQRVVVREPIGANAAKKGEKQKYKSIPLETPEEIVKEAACTIGITRVSDLTIRKFCSNPNRMRFPKETVWKGIEFEGARNLFVKFYLIKHMKFYESEIRFSDVRFCREPEKGILWLKSDRGFIRSMHVRAAELQDEKVNLINFTPNGAYERYKGIRTICDKIRSPDPDHIKTQIRPGKSDFEIFIKRMKSRNPRYERHLISEFDPENKLPDFVLKEIKSDEVKKYMEAAVQAINDAEKEAERENPDVAWTIPIDTEEVPFMEVKKRNKRKGSEQDREEEAKNRREKSPDNAIAAVGNIHSMENIDNVDEEDSDIENDVTI